MKSIMILITLLTLSACSSLSEKECQTGDWKRVGFKDGKRGTNDLSRFQKHNEACQEYGISVDQTLYQTGIDEGYKAFCKNHGKTLGTKADKTEAREDCKNTKAFKTGWNQGLKTYCTYVNGEKFGKIAGEHNAINCSSKLKSTFLKGYSSGIAQYCARKNGFQIAKNGQEYKPSKCPGHMRSDFERAYQKGQEYSKIKAEIAKVQNEINELKSKATKLEASADLKNYLQVEITKKETMQQQNRIELAKIEGFIGL